MKVLHLGDADHLAESVPELHALAESLAWLVFCADPAHGQAPPQRPGAAPAPMPGSDTAWARRELQRARRAIWRIHERIDGAVERQGSPPVQVDDAPACPNEDCPTGGRRLRFGSRFCDRCGTEVAG